MNACPTCAADNSAESRFCGFCGSALEITCSRCASFNSIGRKFCSFCGAAMVLPNHADNKLTAVDSADSLLQRGERLDTRDPAAERKPRAERRHLTVMFCDLIDSTELSQRLDPEQWQALLRPYHELCARVVGELEGHVAQFLGDGVLVYFGYPAAHEDDARRAGRAALRILDEMQRMAAEAPEALTVRIGIHAGPVLVDQVGSSIRHEFLALGETPNVAARVQAIAEPNTAVISESIYHLIAGMFECEALGSPQLKGLAKPLRLFRLVRETHIRGRFDVAISAGLLPLVGRDQELGLLRDRLSKVEHGEGQVVMLRGEPGLGKSRLAYEVKNIFAGGQLVEFHCSPYHQNNPLYPIAHYWHSFLGGPNASSEAQLVALENWLASRNRSSDDSLQLLARLLALPLPDRYAPFAIAPRRLREKTRDLMIHWLLEEAEKTPLLLVVEDLHWADPSTLEILDVLIQQAPTARLMLLLTARPEFESFWGARRQITTLALNPLLRADAEKLVMSMLGNRRLPEAVRLQIIDKTDGVPLFVEELTRNVIESGMLLRETQEGVQQTGQMRPLEIPATLEDSLMARLDRLETVKEIAQLGSVIGRDFTFESIEAIYGSEEIRLRQALQKLVDAEILYQHGLGAQARFTFKHQMIRDAAYQSMLNTSRQRCHLQIATLLKERRLPGLPGTPGIVAYHYTQAGLIAESLPMWQMAAQRSMERGAISEALGFLNRGLELLASLSISIDRARLELPLQTTLGVLSAMSRVPGLPRPRKIHARIRELCEQLQGGPEVRRALCVLSHYYTLSANYQAAIDALQPVLSAPEDAREPETYPLAVGGAGNILFHQGHLISAREHMERCVKLYEELKNPPELWLTAIEPAIAGRLFAGWNLWLLGYPDHALRSANGVLALSSKLPTSAYTMFAYYLAGQVSLARGEVKRARELASEIEARCRTEGIEDWVLLSRLLSGIAGTEAEEPMGLDDFLSLLQLFDRSLTNGVTHIFASAAAGCLKAGRTKEALGLIERVLAVVESKGERFCEAEIYRLRGELALKLGPDSATDSGRAEADFLKAIETANRSSARSLELRATMSLARLMRVQGRSCDARSLLEKIYGWFSEGFDSRDLREAKVLLNELR